MGVRRGRSPRGSKRVGGNRLFRLGTVVLDSAQTKAGFFAQLATRTAAFAAELTRGDADGPVLDPDVPGHGGRRQTVNNFSDKVSLVIVEELIRRFNEAANETAGDHFTPREVIRLMVNLLFEPDSDILTRKGIVKTMLDPACGTGGMLAVSDE